jgi:RNA polymerase sigma-70 factor (ECF subfamily)
MDAAEAPSGASADLARRIQSGDRSAEAELVDRYGAAVAVIIRKNVRNAANREDIYQEVFQIAIQKIRGGDLRQLESLPGFIRSLTRNLITLSYRRANPRADAFVDPSAPPSQLQRLLNRERESMARRILSGLASSRDREVLYRYYLQDQDKQQISNDLGLKMLHLNQVLFRARERYRELYNRFVEKEKSNGRTIRNIDA